MQTTDQSIEMSTARNVLIDRGIRYLYVQKQSSPVKRYNTSVNQTNSQLTGGAGITMYEVKRPSMPNSINQSRISSQVTKDKLNWNYSAVDKEPSVEESKGTMRPNFIHKSGGSEEDVVEKDQPKNRPLTPVPESIYQRTSDNTGSAIINDWRAGV